MTEIINYKSKENRFSPIQMQH